jgi:AraC-like DNA-binding protein
MEVAYMLGYEDQNSFFRAFKQWEDRTPSDWRTAKFDVGKEKGQRSQGALASTHKNRDFLS